MIYASVVQGLEFSKSEAHIREHVQQVKECAEILNCGAIGWGTPVMQKGLGIAALILSIFAVLIPVAGPWLTILGAILAAFAYGPGVGMAIAAIIINVVNLMFLSPQVWVALATQPAVAVVLFGPQVAAIVVLVVLHKKHQTSAVGAAPEAATPILEAAPAQAGPSCSSCGAAVQATDVYCESCGARQAPQRPAPAAAGAAREGAARILEAAAAQAGPTCSLCGAAVQVTDVFCESCGERQAPQRPVPAAAGAAAEGATPILEAAPAQVGPTCSSCGAAVQATDVYCESCGARLGAR